MERSRGQAYRHTQDDSCESRNGKKYSVLFVVFQGDRLPILSYRTSLQVKLITVEKENFDMVAGVATESYPDVFDGELGELPGIQHFKQKHDS